MVEEIVFHLMLVSGFYLRPFHALSWGIRLEGLTQDPGTGGQAEG
jgi:hypothetical protein